MKYTVLRQHFGDRMYQPGDERELDGPDGDRLVRQGVLEPAKAKKAEPEAETKAERKPANKAEAAPKNKAR